MFVSGMLSKKIQAQTIEDAGYQYSQEKLYTTEGLSKDKLILWTTPNLYGCLIFNYL